MAETQSTTTQASAPTGDIKIFIDAFNKDFDVELQKLVDAQKNYKNAYADAIKITTYKEGAWPNDPKVVTIGDLFKYTFPDIESTNIVKPNRDNQEEYLGWLKDLSTNKDENIRKLFKTIESGLRSNREINEYQNLKKPGVTNPNLWSPGQYYFDVFMRRMLSDDGPLKDPTPANGGAGALGADVISGYSFAKSHGGSASVASFDPSGEVDPTKHDELGILDYYEFYDILTSGYQGVQMSDQMYDTTRVDIGGFNENYAYNTPIVFSSLRVQYKTGILTELLTDPKFNRARGNITDANGKYVNWEDTYGGKDLTGYKFEGNYEHILLYKAFIQAGDNYKSVVLPVRNPEPAVQPVPAPIAPPLPISPPSLVEYTFNVEKKDTFIVVGGTVSPPLELVLVPNDGTQYLFDSTSLDLDELSDEYTEGDFQGTEESIFIPSVNEGYPSVDTDTLNSLKGFDPNNPDPALSTDTNAKYPVSKNKDANIKEIINQAKKAGVTNKFAISAILAIVSKESGFVPQSECSYRNTSGSRCVKIFGRRGLTDAQWDELRKDDVKFFNFVYGPQAGETKKYGNGPSDGYKYRGRGFNQITFKSAYEKYKKNTGYDLIDDPDLLNTVPVAAACVVDFFKSGLKTAPSGIKSQYNFTDINSFSNLNDAVGAVYHCNAGFGHSYSSIVADPTGGRKKAFANAGPLYNSYGSSIA